jgi:hypothetical protein
MTKIAFTESIPAPTSRLISQLNIGDMFMDANCLYLVLSKTKDHYSKIFNLTNRHELDIGGYSDKFVNVIRKIHITCEY